MISIPHIQKGETGSLSFAEKNNSYSRSIFFLYAIFIAIGMGIIFIRLFQLTVVRGKYFSSLADQNRVKEVIIEAPRGTITDRKGKILASNSKPDMYSKNLRIESTRTYYQSDAISHVVGYRQTADENDLENDPCVNKLILGDKTGKKGIEQLLECDLRGEHGKKLIEVDAHGAYKKTLSVFQPKHGENIKLAMDLTLQETAYDALGKEKGAVVVAISDSRGTLYNKEGLDWKKCWDIKNKKGGTVTSSKEGEVKHRDTIYEMKVDVLIPAAGSDVINDKNVKRVKAKVVVEGANIPMKPNHEAILHKKGTLVIPDIIANSGGVISSYAELQGYSPAKMFKLVEEKIMPNVRAILKTMDAKNMLPRDAALKIARDRVLKAKK